MTTRGTDLQVEAGSAPQNPGPASSYPRLLLLDFTKLGDQAATGQLKESLFQDWPRDRLFQLFGGWRPDVGTYVNDQFGSVKVTAPGGHEALLEQVEAFDPEVIVFRPVADAPYLHRLAMEIIATHHVPLIAWIVDDWPAALKIRNPRQYLRLDRDLRGLFRQCNGALSIGEAMSSAFSERYGVPFASFANGVDQSDWQFQRTAASDETVRIRYAGWIGDNMGAHTLLSLAASVERLAARGMKVSFEIGTRPSRVTSYRSHFGQFKNTSLRELELPRTDYRRWLSEADITTICYNFDAASKEFVRYSVANKLPECLASGAALLAIGPPDIATMQLLAQIDCCATVNTSDPDALDRALTPLVQSRERRLELGRQGQAVAFSRFGLNSIRSQFVAWIEETAACGRTDAAILASRRTEAGLWKLRSLLDGGGAPPRERRSAKPISPIDRLPT